MTEVSHLAARRAADDNSKWTPEEMLRCVADELSGQMESAVVVVRLKDEDPEVYDSGFRLANVHFSEAISLMEIAKAMMLRTLTGGG